MMEEIAAYLAAITATQWLGFAIGLFAGGFVKGLQGIGLPLVALPIVSSVLPVQTAIAIILLPILVTNIYQIRIGRDVLPIARRFLPLIVGLVVGILVGAYALSTLSADIVRIVLGAVILAFVATRVRAPDWQLGPRGERILALPVGLVAGLVGGVSSIYGPPIVIFLSALRLDRHSFVRTIGLVFISGLVPLYAALTAFDVLGPKEAAHSVLALIPVFIGFKIGERLRGRISESAFQRSFTLLMTAIGITLLYRGVMAIL